MLPCSQPRLVLILSKRWCCLQVRKLWEALLSSRPEMQSGKGAARLEALVQARLVGGVTSIKRAAESKRVYDLEGGFMMTKVMPPEHTSLSRRQTIAGSPSFFAPLAG